MKNVYITGTGQTTIANKPRGVKVQVNKALTGVITVRDGSTTVGLITNPTVGQIYEYGQFTGIASLQSDAACDVTAWSI